MKLLRSEHIYDFSYKSKGYIVRYEHNATHGGYGIEVSCGALSMFYRVAKGSYPSRRQAASLVVQTEREGFVNTNIHIL